MTQMDAIVALDPLRPITPQLTQLLRDRIIRNQLEPGNRISETEIAKAYDISRQPVREAFIKLQEQGLLSVLPQRGTIVSKIAYQAVLDARFLREAIEADIILILTEIESDALVLELRSQLKAQRKLRKAHSAAFIQLDEQFHRTLAEAAGKGGTWKQIEGLKSQMDRVRFLSLGQFPVDKLIAQHSQIVEAIAEKNPQRAEAAVRRHLREVLVDLPNIIATYPDFFDLPNGALQPPINTPIPGGDTT